jgi:hypothetical protein
MGLTGFPLLVCFETINRANQKPFGGEGDFDQNFRCLSAPKLPAEKSQNQSGGERFLPRLDTI